MNFLPYFSWEWPLSNFTNYLKLEKRKKNNFWHMLNFCCRERNKLSFPSAKHFVSPDKSNWGKIEVWQLREGWSLGKLRQIWAPTGCDSQRWAFTSHHSAKFFLLHIFSYLIISSYFQTYDDVLGCSRQRLTPPQCMIIRFHQPILVATHNVFPTKTWKTGGTEWPWSKNVTDRGHWITLIQKRDGQGAPDDLDPKMWRTGGTLNDLLDF